MGDLNLLITERRAELSVCMAALIAEVPQHIACIGDRNIVNQGEMYWSHQVIVLKAYEEYVRICFKFHVALTSCIIIVIYERCTLQETGRLATDVLTHAKISLRSEVRIKVMEFKNP